MYKSIFTEGGSSRPGGGGGGGMKGMAIMELMKNNANGNIVW